MHLEGRIDLKLLTRMLGLLTRQQGLQYLQILFHMARRLAVVQPEHIFDHKFVGQADTQHKAAIGRSLAGQRLLRHRHRVARVGRRYRRTQFQ